MFRRLGFGDERFGSFPSCQARRSDFQIWDPDELDFPFKQWTRFDCLEDPQKKHTVDPSHLRQAYLENLEKYRENFTKGCHRNRIDLVPMTTDQPYADALAYYLALRKRGKGAMLK